MASEHPGGRWPRPQARGGRCRRWRIDGRPSPHLDGCRDVDLESSALTNALPVHGLGLHVGQGAEAPAACVRALDLSAVPEQPGPEPELDPELPRRARSRSDRRGHRGRLGLLDPASIMGTPAVSACRADEEPAGRSTWPPPCPRLGRHPTARAATRTSARVVGRKVGSETLGTHLGYRPPQLASTRCAERPPGRLD